MFHTSDVSHFITGFAWANRYAWAAHELHVNCRSEPTLHRTCVDQLPRKNMTWCILMYNGYGFGLSQSFTVCTTGTILFVWKLLDLDNIRFIFSILGYFRFFKWSSFRICSKFVIPVFTVTVQFVQFVTLVSRFHHVSPWSHSLRPTWDSAISWKTCHFCWCDLTIVDVCWCDLIWLIWLMWFWYILIWSYDLGHDVMRSPRHHHLPSLPLLLPRSRPGHGFSSVQLNQESLKLTTY